MIDGYVVFRDWETAEKNPYGCQPVQLGAVAIDLRTQTVIKSSLFESLMKPEFDDEKAIAEGWLPVNDEALTKNKITREELAEAPERGIVWEQYIEWTKGFNQKGKAGTAWTAPVVAGMNNIKFDDIIDKNMCERYGPKLSDRGELTIYNPRHNFDIKLMLEMFFFQVNFNDFGSYGMDACREFFGYSTENAHKADVDVLQGADLLCRFLRLFKKLTDGTMYIAKGKRIKFKNCVDGAL